MVNKVEQFGNPLRIVISTKRADCGQPEHTLIAVGTSSGHVMFYLENGILLLEQVFHQSPVRKISYRGFCQSQPHTTLSIIYDGCIVELDGWELHQTLRVARVNPDAVDKTGLKSKKLNFTSIAGVGDCSSNGQFAITRWDQYINAAAYGANEKVSSRIPSYHSYTTSNCDFVSFYHHVDVVDQSAISSAFSIGKNLVKKSTGWFFGGGGGASSLPKEEEEIKIDSGLKMHVRSQITDKGQRRGGRIVPAPYGLPLAAVSDALGRVSIVDTNNMTILRMIKGMRDAQVAWLRSSDESRNALFLVLVDRNGSVSVISAIFGPRVALWNLGKGAKLLTETHQMGVNAQNVKSIAPSNYQVAVLTPEGEIRRICVPLHLALNDQNSPRLADLATLKELGQQLRTVSVDESQITALLSRLRLSNTQRQAIEKIIASEKFTVESIKKFMDIFDNKSDQEKLSGSKESKEFIFWSDRMRKMIKIFEILSDETTSNENIIDSFSIFPSGEVGYIRAIFEFKKQMDQLSVSKVRFKENIAAKSLYDFTRSFAEENGSFKLHPNIRKLFTKQI